VHPTTNRRRGSYVLVVFVVFVIHVFVVDT
jgi:hypothetical protein